MTTVTQEFKQRMINGMLDAVPLTDGIMTIEVEYIKDKRVGISVLICDPYGVPLVEIITTVLKEGDRLILADIRNAFNITLQ